MKTWEQPYYERVGKDQIEHRSGTEKRMQFEREMREDVIANEIYAGKYKRGQL